MPKKYVRRRKFKRNAPSVKSLAKRVSTLFKGIELKYSHQNFAGIALDRTPTMNIRPYSDISVGTSDYKNRIGDSILVKRVNVRSIIYNAPTGNTANVRCLAFIYKKNPDAINSSFSTIINLYLESAGVNGVYTTITPKDFDNRKSFVTLYDKRRVFDAGNTATVGRQLMWDLSLRIPKAYQKVMYSAGGTSVVSNELLICFIQENTTNISITYYTDMYYTDS